MTRLLPILPPLLVLLLACGNSEPDPEATSVTQANDRRVEVTAATAETRTVPDVLELTGTLSADEESRVTPLVPGRVSEVLVERGQRVHRGEPLVRLRTSDYRLAAESAEAALSQARARLGIERGEASRFRAEDLPDVKAADANRQLAEDALARAERLADTGAISQADLEGARQRAAAAREQHASALDSARSAYFALQNARVALDRARRNLADSTVSAPFDGEVAERHVSVGEFVSPQQPVVTLVRSDPLRLELAVPQERIGDVHRGQRVEVHVDAYPDRTFEGTVRFVGATVRADTRALTIEAVVPNPPAGGEDEAVDEAGDDEAEADGDGLLRPGLFATARLVLGGEREVVAVPARAVRSEAGVHRVFTIADGQVREHVVSIAERTDDEVLLAGGIEGGAKVATDRLDTLSDGMDVTVAGAAAAAEGE